jgi:hypothetical protein
MSGALRSTPNRAPVAVVLVLVVENLAREQNFNRA